MRLFSDAALEFIKPLMRRYDCMLIKSVSIYFHALMKLVAKFHSFLVRNKKWYQAMGDFQKSTCQSCTHHKNFLVCDVSRERKAKVYHFSLAFVEGKNCILVAWKKVLHTMVASKFCRCVKLFNFFF